MTETEKPFKRDEFVKMCEARWGSSWVGPAAAFFKVAERTVVRWKNEDYQTVPPGLRDEAEKELRQHAERLLKMADRLRI